MDSIMEPEHSSDNFDYLTVMLFAHVVERVTHKVA